MNVPAKCVNPECEANGIEKSVVIGQVLGYGAANDRVKLSRCTQMTDFELEGHFTAVKSRTTKTSLRINRG